MKKLGITASMSGWEKFITDTSNSSLGKDPEEYTIPELLAEIREIKRNFNPETLERLLIYMDDHIHDPNNPHGTDLESMGTNVIYELYKVWKEQGATGDVKDLIRILFQYVEIADIPTTLEGKSTSKLVSVKGAKELYKKHIVDPNAHDEMFRAIFPGHAPHEMPTLSAQAFVGAPVSATVVRDSKMYYHGPDGYLYLEDKNKLAVDHINGDPMYSIWDKRKNMATHSKTLTSGTFVGGNPNIYKGDLSPFKDLDAILFTEDNEQITKEHGYITEEYNFEEGKTYTISIYVLPILRPYFTITLPEELAGKNAYEIHNLTEKNKKFTPIDFDKNINTTKTSHLPIEFVRVEHSFVAQATMSASAKLLFTEIADGDTTYIGEEVNAGALIQLQVEEGLGASPAIITENTPIERPATFVKIPFKKIFNIRSGSLIVEGAMPSKLDIVKRQYLYEVGSDKGSTLRGYYKLDHKQKLYMESFNTYGNPLDAAYGSGEVREIKRHSHSYDINVHCYGSNGMYPKLHELAGGKISYSDAISDVITKVIPNYKNLDAEVLLIQYKDKLTSSQSTIDNMSPKDALAILLTDIHEHVKTNKDDNDVALIDMLEKSEVQLHYMLNDEADFIYLGCDRTGTNFYNGYIKSIVYYPVYSNELKTEFNVGEYTDDDQD